VLAQYFDQPVEDPFKISEKWGHLRPQNFDPSMSLRALPPRQRCWFHNPAQPAVLPACAVLVVPTSLQQLAILPAMTALLVP
jgi:hypothetical protein